MADASLELLQTMVQRALDGIARIETGQGELIQRVGRLERVTAGLHEDFAAHSVRLDNLADRLTRIERRLGLIEV